MKDIAYQNKDITSKLFAEKFEGKSLRVYGLDIPKIKQVLPTNIPQIQANELRIDNVFLLEDDTIAIIDYESAYKKENKHKYIQYVNHVAEYYNKKFGKDIKVRMIVIYTADVERFQTNDVLDVGCLRFEIESAYLSELDSEDIKKRLETKISNQEPLTDEEMMEFIILPLTYKGNDNKNKSIKSAIDMASTIKDEEVKVFLLSGVAVFADKVISKEYAEEIRRLLCMTKVGKLFEDEKIQYAENCAKEGKIRMVVDAVEKGTITKQQAATMLECSLEELEQKCKEVMQLA